MNRKKLFKSLIFISNLAIPPNLNIKKGLGDLLNFDIVNCQMTSPLKFTERNKELLEHCYFYTKIKDFNWDLLLENLYKNFDSQKVKFFLEDFRVFAIKNYFSRPSVLRDLSLLEKSDHVNDNIENEKDKAILNSLTNEQQRFIR